MLVDKLAGAPSGTAPLLVELLIPVKDTSKSIISKGDVRSLVLSYG